MEGRAVILLPGFRVVHSSRLGGPSLLIVVHACDSQLGAEVEQPALRARASGQMGHAVRQRLCSGQRQCREAGQRLKHTQQEHHAEAGRGQVGVDRGTALPELRQQCPLHSAGLSAPAHYALGLLEADVRLAQRAGECL